MTAAHDYEPADAPTPSQFRRENPAQEGRPTRENEAQRAAIVHAIDAPLKIAAGPGTGKTYVLANRYLHLLAAHGLEPGQILALTFTNRAAAEMRQRVTRYALEHTELALSALDLSEAWIGTFHGICLRLLQENPLAAGLPFPLAAMDEPARRRLRAELRARFLGGAFGSLDEPDSAPLLDLAEDGFWSGVWQTIDRLQDDIVTPAAFAQAACARSERLLAAASAALEAAKTAKQRREAAQARRDYTDLPRLARAIQRLYEQYLAELRRRGALDFPGQINAAYRLLMEQPAVRQRYRAQFRHILVDEVQDTSRAQMRLIEALAADGMANVTVIGDRKQSIYGWRGARPKNLDDFPAGAPPRDSQDFPAGEGRHMLRDSPTGEGQHTLRDNYRSPQAILDVAAFALAPLRETGRVTEDELALRAAARGDDGVDGLKRGADGVVVTVAGPIREPERGEEAPDPRRREAAYVARRVAALLAEPVVGPETQPRDRRYRGEDVVILLRSVATAGPYEEALRQAGVPTLIIGGKGFYGRPEVRDALALLRAAVDPYDDAALVRAMESPLCGLPDVAVAALARHAGGHLYEGLIRAETLPFSLPERDEAVRRSAALAALLERVGRRLEGLPLPELLWGALEESGYLDYARTRPGVERERLLANLEKLRRAATGYAAARPLATAASFARQLSYLFDEEIDEAEESLDAGPDVVRLMTIHQAKGNEFPVVIVANATPRSYRLSDPPFCTYDEDEGFLLLQRRDPETLELRDGADIAEYKARERERYLEEERYVWYVALTRAKERLILTTPRPLEKAVRSHEQWPLGDLYRALTAPEVPAMLCDAVGAVEIDDVMAGEGPVARRDAPVPPASEAVLEAVRAAARLASQAEPPVAAPPAGPIALSYSGLRTYRACPRRYQLRFALGLPETPAALRPPSPDGAPGYDPALLGYAVHAALERHPDPARATLDGLLEVFRVVCRAQGLEGEEIERVYRPHAERMLERYLRGEVAPGQVQRVYAELAVRQLLRDAPIPVHLVGRIDRVVLDGAGWRMVDVKTHRALAPADVEEAGLQLRLYKAAWQAGAAQALGEEAGDPRLYVYEATSGALHEVDGGPRALEAAVNLLCDVAGKIAAGDFAVPPDYAPPCANCAFGGPYGLCPDRRNRATPTDPATGDPANADAEAALAGEVYGARRYDHGAAPGQYPMLGPNRLDEDQGPIPDATGEQARTPTGVPCFICRLDERCARAYLSGTLRAVQLGRDDGAGRVRALLVEEDGRESWLELAPPWHSLGHTLHDVLASGARVRLAAYHVARGAPGERPSYRAAEKSLVALDPDTLIDVTAVARAEYCARKSLIEELSGRGAGAALAEGSAVHVAVARGLLSGEAPLDYLDAALSGAASTLALAGDGDDALSTRERLEEHLRRAGEWLEAHPHEGRVRVEALLLSPGLGLRGRADAIFDPAGRPVVLDLKTGRSDGPDPRREHALQLAAYMLLLRERGREPLPGWLLYTGNSAGDIGRRVPAGLDDFTRVLRLRNELAAMILLGRAPLSPYRGRCIKCPVIGHCRTLSFLNGEAEYALGTGEREARESLDEGDARFFRHYNALLRLEGRAAGAAVRDLWRRSAQERVERGTALDVAGALRTVTPLEGGEELWRFSLENRSELREGDVVLAGDGDPIMGEVEQGVIERANAGALWVRLRGALAAEPRLVDRYAVDAGWRRGLRTLWQWTTRSRELRRLVRGDATPAFDPIEEPELPGANAQQRRAVAQALAARGYLLVQGPPGAGKTRTIAQLARALRGRGQRVLLASFTNRAVDAMLAALEPDERAVTVRLGGEAATDPAQRDLLLARRAAAEGLAEPARIAARLDGAGIVAATVATLASAGYDEQRFDVAIVDEASQLTVPDLLAALRVARRFVLVGDDKQLPPVVQSAEATHVVDDDGRKVGLDIPLFTLLRRRVEDASGPDQNVAASDTIIRPQPDDYTRPPSADAAMRPQSQVQTQTQTQTQDMLAQDVPYAVMLEQQYRMNAEICAFPSAEWYGGRLQPGTPAVARGRLALRLEAVPPPLRGVLDPERPAVFLDVAPAGGDAPNTSRAEAERVRDLSAALVAGGVAPADIGVIAPYRAQVALLRNMLREAGLGAVVADTVDRFQGSQRDAMLLSLVGGRGRVGHLLLDERRLNVALTRARHKLILLGHAPELRAAPLYARLLDAIIQTAERQ